MHKTLSILLTTLLFISCTKSSVKDENALSSSDSTAIHTAQEAYLYGLPLVLMDISRRQMTSSSSSTYALPNTFFHHSSFPDATFRSVVRPNADTYYSSAWLDLTSEPVVLSLPDTKGRYYMMPMLDAYTNVFASPGSRTTGTKAGVFLITGPQWQGTVPADMKEIKAPTNYVWIIGRTQVNSKDDGNKVVVPLQKQYKLLTLSTWNKSPLPQTQADSSAVPQGDPNAIVKAMSTEEYFNYVNQLLKKNPPPAADKAAMDRFATIGIGAGKKFDSGIFSTAASAEINKVPEHMLAELQNAFTSGQSPVNGWNTGKDVIGTYGTDYASRAAVSFFGLGANLREDAIYPSAMVDDAGAPLNGANKYILHFDKGQTPPVNAFWSLTMYDADGYFIDNPINRYAIGDRSNLKLNTDGSVDIYIQKESPGKAKEANWLPAPPGNFNILMRVYWPKEEMLNKTWTPPGIKKQN